MFSKHVEASNKLIIKFSTLSWLILRNKYIEVHGQQNIKTLLMYFLNPHYGPEVDSVSNRNEYQEYFLGVKAAGA